MVLFYFDTETTGLKPDKCSIWQLSGYISNTKTRTSEFFDFKMKPYKGEIIEPGAAKATHVTQEFLETLPPQEEVFKSFLSLLRRYVNFERWTDKIIPIGYNVAFDLDFLKDWFTFNNSLSLYFNNILFPGIDVMYLASFELLHERKHMRNFQLSTVYEKMVGKKLENAHNASADITATREILDKIVESRCK